MGETSVGSGCREVERMARLAITVRRDRRGLNRRRRDTNNNSHGLLRDGRDLCWFLPGAKWRALLAFLLLSTAPARGISRRRRDTDNNSRRSPSATGETSVGFWLARSGAYGSPCDSS